MSHQQGSDVLTFDVRAGVATAALARPAAYNALDLDLTAALVGRVEECRERDDVRAVVITGSGRAFCAGGDMRVTASHQPRPDRYLRELTKYLHRLIADLRALPKPVLAAVNGAAVGAGFSLAMACDLRIAAESAYFKQAYTSIGLVPDGGWSTFVPAAIGYARASHLLLLDPQVPAATALQWGLVDEVVPDAVLPERARELADRLAAGPAAAYARGKQLITAGSLAHLHDGLEMEREFIVRVAAGREFAEGVRAFLEKRAPDFRGVGGPGGA